LRVDPLNYASWLALLGAYDRALALLEHLPVQRGSSNTESIWDPEYDPIRNDPRFKAVLEKIGLPYVPSIAPLAPNSPGQDFTSATSEPKS
jgi:hypothetical protein